MGLFTVQEAEDKPGQTEVSGPQPAATSGREVIVFLAIMFGLLLVATWAWLRRKEVLNDERQRTRGFELLSTSSCQYLLDKQAETG